MWNVEVNLFSLIFELSRLFQWTVLFYDWNTLTVFFIDYRLIYNTDSNFCLEFKYSTIHSFKWIWQLKIGDCTWIICSFVSNSYQQWMTINLPMCLAVEPRFLATFASRLSVWRAHTRYLDLANGCKRPKQGFGRVVRLHKPMKWRREKPYRLEHSQKSSNMLPSVRQVLAEEYS